MYDLGDMGKSFDAEKAAGKRGTPRLPKTDVTYEAVLKRVTEEEGDTSGKFYQFAFAITKSSSDAVLVGKTYTLGFFQGASRVDREKCWKKMAPIIAACSGLDLDNKEDVAKLPAQLGEFLAISRPYGKTLEDGADLDLPFRGKRERNEARPDKKTGQVPPEFLDENGKPKVFNNDYFDPIA